MNESGTAFELCIVCNAPFVNLTRRLRKTCSSECARKNKNRRREASRKRKKTQLRMATKRFCKTCNADISWRRSSSRYCSRNCCISAQHARERETACTRVWLCRKCGQSVPNRRFVCDGCLIIKSYPHKKGYSYVKGAKTIEERIRRGERMKQSAKKHKQLVRAANAVFRELQNKPKKPPLLPLPPPTCVVCGIVLTNFRKRNLCGSKVCRKDRDLERARCSYYGLPLRATPRMVAAADRYPLSRNTGKTGGKFRDPKPKQYRRRSQPERHRREYAIYVAMREMNLLPTENDL